MIINALQIGPQTTIDFRERWGVMNPAQRISELKKKGNVIISPKVDAHTADGMRHGKVARYALLQLAPPHILKQPASLLAANDSHASNANKAAA